MLISFVSIKSCWSRIGMLNCILLLCDCWIVHKHDLVESANLTLVQIDKQADLTLIQIDTQSVNA